MSAPVTTSWTTINGSAGSFDAYLALPPAGRGPGLLLLQEIFGVNEHIRSVAEQYALDGFVVLAPDVFWQQQRRLDIGYTPEDIQRGRALAMAADRSALQRDLADARAGAARAARSARPRHRRHRLLHGRAAGLRGRGHGRRRCRGGLLRRRHPGHARPGAADPLPDAVPLRRARRQHSADAPWTRCVPRWPATPRFFVYDSADHGFNCWARGSYHAASAALAHGRTLQFLAERLF